MPPTKKLQVLTKEKLELLDKFKTLIYAYDLCLCYYYGLEKWGDRGDIPPSEKLLIDPKEWKFRFSPASFYFSSYDATIIIGSIYFNYFFYRDRGDLGYFPENLLNISNILWSGFINFINNIENKKEFGILEDDNLYDYEIAKKRFQEQYGKTNSIIFFSESFNKALSTDKEYIDVDSWISILKSKILTFKI